MGMATDKAVAEIQGRLALLEQVPYAVAFMRPKSDNWPLVQDMCRKWGEFYQDDGVSFALFRNDEKTLHGLNALFRLIDGWKSALLFVDGEPTTIYQSFGWLSCYLQSRHAANIAAYCLKTDTAFGSAMRPVGHYIAPCRLLVGWLSHLSPAIPASLTEQVQSIAIDRGLFRCPHFNADNFRQL